VQLAPDFTQWPRLNQLTLTITNLSDGTLTNGTWMLLQDDESGNRQALDVDWSVYPGTLAPNESFTVTFPALISHRGQYTLAFKANGAPTDDFTIEVVAKCFKPTIGACCLTGETCLEMEDVECEANLGTFVGAGTTCADGCRGACCLEDGCQLRTQAACTNLGGNFRGVGTQCENDCPGACCTASGCQIVSQSNCVDMNGTFHGAGSQCSECPLRFVSCNWRLHAYLCDFAAADALPSSYSDSKLIAVGNSRFVGPCARIIKRLSRSQCRSHAASSISRTSCRWPQGYVWHRVRAGRALR
jgi:hypothetical protein